MIDFCIIHFVIICILFAITKYICAIVLVIKIRSVQTTLDPFYFQLLNSNLLFYLKLLFFFVIGAILILLPLFLLLSYFWKIFRYFFGFLYFLGDIFIFILSSDISRNSSERACQIDKYNLYLFISNSNNYQTDNSIVKVFRFMNVDLYGDIMLVINDWSKKNCEIGSAWEKIIYLYEILFFVLYGFIILSSSLFCCSNCCTCCNSNRIENSIPSNEQQNDSESDLFVRIQYNDR